MQSVPVQPQVLEDFLIAEGPPEPWNRLHATLQVDEDFSAGARRCGEFVRSVEEHHSVKDIFARLLDPAVPAKWLEYIVFCLLDTSTPHLQVAKQALRLKCLRRLLMRQSTSGQVSEEESRIAADLAAATGVRQVDDLMSFAFRARDLVSSLEGSLDVDEQQRRLLVAVIRAEVAALSERMRRISDEVDVYNLKEMARVLPRVRTFDENARDARELADAIERRQPLGARALTFEAAVKAGDFEAWLQPLREDRRTSVLYHLLLQQRRKLASTRSLVALATLWRWITEAGGHASVPLLWIAHAVTTYEGETFSIDAGDSVGLIRHFLENSGAWIDGSRISGNFSDKLFSQWIGPDMLTRPFAHGVTALAEAPVNMRDLIAAHLSNDRLILRLLDCSKVYETYGLVEYIATRSHSVTVLTKIATYNFLFAGSANQGVPRALLRNPAPIPMDLLRPFLKASFFTVSGLRSLLGIRDLRTEVAQEIRAALANRA